jgi:hypothetical protein
MNVYLFNFCIALGWLMVTFGCGWLQPWLGLIVGGGLLLWLTLFMSRIGGIYVPNKGAG